MIDRAHLKRLRTAKHLALSLECLWKIFQKTEREEIQAMPWWLKD